MKLYEVTNGYCGNSYIRCYVWAETETNAREAATLQYKKAYQKALGKTNEDAWPDLELEYLFDDQSEPFVTEISDDGWEIKETT